MDDGGRDRGQGWPDGDWAHLGVPLRARRRELRLSQRQLATRAGVSHATVGRLETGQLDVALHLVLSVLDAAGLRLALQHQGGSPVALPPEQVVDLNRLDTGGRNRLPAHLPHRSTTYLPTWTFTRRAARGNPPIFDRSERWVFHRPGPVVCHPAPMEAASTQQAASPGPMASTDHRFYRQLAPWWPLLSPVAEYEEEAAFVATFLHSAGIGVRDVLELGSGGGNNAAHLKQHFSLTLVDLSPEMIAVSRALNPQCRHLVGDMRELQLDEQFDAVFVHDAIDYMTTEEDLRAVLATAYEHCRPGGIALFLPDHVGESYSPGTGSGGVDGDDGRSARYHSWAWDPDPADTWTLTTYAFVLRGADGALDVCHETHRLGLFPRATWLQLLGEAGFEASATEEETEQETGEDRLPRTVFIGHRPRA